MQSNIQTNNEPIPPKYLRTHFQKFRSSKIKRQEQNYPQKLKSHTKQNRIVTEIDEQLQLTYNNIKQHQANYFSFSQVINKKYPQSQFQNKDQVINQSFFNRLKYSTVKDYVHYIYLNYNIKDPLQNTFCQTPKHKITKQKKQSQTRKKIMSLKQNFQQELNSQSTTKKERATDNQTRQSFLTKRQTDVSQFLLRNSYLNNSYHSNHSYNVINNQQIQHIKQEFRYCFMCGQAVLTANIQYHENTCEPLRRAYNMNIDQLLKIINQKISQIKTQIHEKFIQKDKTQLGQMLFGIQTVMKNQISIQNCKQTSEQVKVYEIIQEQIQKSNLLAVFDLMSRLKWFSYLKINMQRHRVKKQQPYWKNNI